MFQLLRDMTLARSVVDLNIAAGVARPKIHRFWFLASISVFAALGTAVALLWVSYYNLGQRLDKSDATEAAQIAALTTISQRQEAALRKRFTAVELKELGITP